MIIGTAGHIDHGKTALVRALTGVDTDRLPEEKRRGITIDLGFAPLRLAGVGVIGVVDVPGHEAFVRTMLAGATGIDVAVLVIAADEGPMPQTREHLAILTLLGIRHGVIVLTKCDLVAEDWLELVTADVRELVQGTPLADAPIIPASSVTGAGLEAVRQAIGQAARVAPPRRDDDLFRMPIDRAFSVRGTGTVVTGTVWTGSLAKDSTVFVLPAGRTTRVRGLQCHGAAVSSVGTGDRAAVALAGVELDAVGRGTTLVADECWQTTSILRADVSLLSSDHRPPSARTWVRLHLGTADVGARIVAPSGALRSGSSAGCRVILDGPIVARAGDRFVLRSSSPQTTIGGGLVLDPLPAHRRSKPWSAVDDQSVHLARILDDAAGLGESIARLPIRLGISPGAVRYLIERQVEVVVEAGDRLFAIGAVERIANEIESLVADHHRSHPIEPGAPLQSLRGRIHGDPGIIEHVLRLLVGEGRVELAGAVIRRSGYRPNLTEADATLRDQIIVQLRTAGLEPPSAGELAAALGARVPDLLRHLEREGTVLAVESDRFFARDVLDHLFTKLRDTMVPAREYGPGEMRDLIGVSRKYLIPLLEYCDRRNITERRHVGRVLVGTKTTEAVS